MAGWFSLVLLGRIALAAGLKGALRQSPRQLPLMDLAFGVMVVSVALEIAAFALAAGAGWLASNGERPDRCGSARRRWRAALPADLRAHRSVPRRQFLRDAAVRIVSTMDVGTPAGVIAGLAFDAGALADVFDLLTTVTALGFWVWMLATGIFVYRRAGRSEDRMVPTGQGGT